MSPGIGESGLRLEVLIGKWNLTSLQPRTSSVSTSLELHRVTTLSTGRSECQEYVVILAQLVNR